MRIGFLQFAPKRLEVEDNLRRILAFLEPVEDALVVTPELAVSGYLFRNERECRDAGTPPDDPRLHPFFALLAKNRLHAVLGLIEPAERGVYNTALLAGPDGPLGTYRKIHLFDREKRIFLPGEQPPPVFEVAGARLGLMICWDWFFPETARFLGRRGAQVVAHPANLVLPWCLDAMRTRSLENRLFTVTANRTGAETLRGVGLSFYGRSQVVDPDGERILAVGGDAVEGVFTVDLDPARADEKAMTPGNPGPGEARRDLLDGAHGAG